MASRASPALGSVYSVEQLGPNVQRQHAARLLLTGYDLESAAALSGLTLDQVHELAATVDLEELTRKPPP